MLKLVEIIKTALNEIGCEELPSGCDDVIEQTFIDNNLSHDQSDTPHSSSYLLQKGHEVMSIFRTFRRKSGPPNSPTRTPKHGRSSENLGSSVISLDFREVTTCDDCNENVIDDANNDCTNNNVNVTNTDHISDTEEVFEDIDVISDTNNIINNNNDVCYRSTNNIYVDIEANDMHNESNPFCSHQFVGDECLKTIETEVEIDEDDEVEMKSNENLRVSKTVEEKNDSKNNLLLGGDDNNSNKDENKKSEEIMQKSTEKLSFTEKLKNKIRKSSSTDGTTIGLSSDSKDNNKDTNVSNLKDRFNRFKNAKGDNYRSLSETESEASRASFKKLKGKSRKKRLFRQLTEEQNLMGCEEKFESIENPENLKSIIPSTGKKKSKSISSTIMTHIRDIKMKNGGNKVREIDPKDREKTKAMTNEMSNRLSEIKFLFEAEAKDIEFEEIVESEAESLINVKHPIEQAGYHSLFPYDKPEDTIKNEDFTSMPPHIQITDLDDDETIEYPIENQNLNPSESKSKFKFAQSIKSRLKLRLRKHKKLSETSFHDQTSPPKACNMCTKPIKCNLHASPTVADFEKEFHTSEIFTGDVYYCSCVRDESSCCSENSSADGNITIKNRNIEVKTSTDSIKSSSTSNCSVRENDTFIFFFRIMSRYQEMKLL
uniref:CSON012816 protein n=1 Tax=Culicoides sonorensis TaxID=179676 RepID=A0A336M989_CULSO